MMPPRPPLVIEKLADKFGQYELIIRCKCGHLRQASPYVFAKILGWQATLKQVAQHLRCSRCGAKNCTVEAIESRSPRGYRNH